MATSLTNRISTQSPDDSLKSQLSTRKPRKLDSGLLNYLIVGTLFGIVFVKAEIISWFRIQEMFRVDSFHMYGVIGSAILVGMGSVWLIKRFNIKTRQGETVTIAPKTFHKGQIYGGLIFGMGWALTGACPGPLFAQIGSGFLIVGVTLLSAIGGTWVYGYFRDDLPH
ncbi:DUF6691 family protein [Siphonobacter sp.]|uniref:DUF6691 family protein n=1 Tax=Siphonobacter sp. TaxID=1869184 RepID=UPI003B3ABD75